MHSAVAKIKLDIFPFVRRTTYWQYEISLEISVVIIKLILAEVTSRSTWQGLIVDKICHFNIFEALLVLRENNFFVKH